MQRSFPAVLLITAIVLAGCVASPAQQPDANGSNGVSEMQQAPAATDGQQQQPTEGDGVMKISSSAFKDSAKIPAKFTCDGQGVSPALSWSGVPANAKSLALTVRDPDAPGGTFNHWLVYDIPATATGIPEGGPLPAGAKQLPTDFGRAGYGGPCPPSGTHRYIFTLYALDAANLQGAAGSSFFQLLEQHAVATAKLTGLYSRQ